MAEGEIMNAKTFGGLVGSHHSVNMMYTPMKAYREARSKGDTATMDRAAGYAGDYAQSANENADQAAQGVKEEAAQAREKLEREQSIENSKVYQENQESSIEDAMAAPNDTITFSEEGKAILESLAKQYNDSREHWGISFQTPVIYTRSGEVIPLEQETVVHTGM
jgi:hypothetical protein